MIAVVFQIIGIGVFLAGTYFLGKELRASPTKKSAERLSRREHLLLYCTLFFPGLLLLVNPGLMHIDETLGVSPLPLYPLMVLISIPLLSIGSYLMVVSNRALLSLGKGAPAFKLTRSLVETDIYSRCRNPMSLGFYLFSLGVGLAIGSSYMTLFTLAAIIPSHIFFLKYFEEVELSIRYGDSYLEYKRRTPFLIPKDFGR